MDYRYGCLTYWQWHKPLYWRAVLISWQSSATASDCSSQNIVAVTSVQAGACGADLSRGIAHAGRIYRLRADRTQLEFTAVLLFSASFNVYRLVRFSAFFWLSFLPSFVQHFYVLFSCSRFWGAPPCLFVSGFIFLNKYSYLFSIFLPMYFSYAYLFVQFSLWLVTVEYSGWPWVQRQGFNSQWKYEY